MDRESWWAIVHGVANSQTLLSTHTHTHTHPQPHTHPHTHKGIRKNSFSWLCILHHHKLSSISELSCGVYLACYPDNILQSPPICMLQPYHFPFRISQWDLKPWNGCDHLRRECIQRGTGVQDSKWARNSTDQVEKGHQQRWKNSHQ